MFLKLALKFIICIFLEFVCFPKFICGTKTNQILQDTLPEGQQPFFAYFLVLAYLLFGVWWVDPFLLKLLPFCLSKPLFKILFYPYREIPPQILFPSYFETCFCICSFLFGMSTSKSRFALTFKIFLSFERPFLKPIFLFFV